MALARVQPVPCRGLVLILWLVMVWKFPELSRRMLVILSSWFFRWPPLIRTFWGPSFWIIWAAVFASLRFLILIPDRISASSMLGVMIRDLGIRVVFREVMAESSRSLSPLVATITGSRMIGMVGCCSSFWFMVSIIGLLASIPILMALNFMSVKMLSSCSLRKSVGGLWMAVTPWVFWAVREVMMVAQ